MQHYDPRILFIPGHHHCTYSTCSYRCTLTFADPPHHASLSSSIFTNPLSNCTLTISHATSDSIPHRSPQLLWVPQFVLHSTFFLAILSYQWPLTLQFYHPTEPWTSLTLDCFPSFPILSLSLETIFSFLSDFLQAYSVLPFFSFHFFVLPFHITVDSWTLIQRLCRTFLFTFIHSLHITDIILSKWLKLLFFDTPTTYFSTYIIEYNINDGI